MISMTTKRKKQFNTPVGRFSYLYCPKAAFSIGVQIKDAGDEKIEQMLNRYELDTIHDHENAVLKIKEINFNIVKMDVIGL